jgi:hypothetical protein
VLGRGCYCIWGASYVSWVFVGGLPFLWVLLGFLWFWGASFASWVFVGGLPLFFWDFSLSFGFPLFLWANWVVPLYTSCVLRALYAFFNKIFLLIKKEREIPLWH